MSPREQSPWELLVVDDNRGDSELLCLALSQWKGRVRVHVVENGSLALSYLKREWPYHEMRRPDLILLDLHLPGKDGIEVLKELRNDPHLRSIPVVMITSSESRNDVCRAYGSCVNSYITKCADARVFFARIRALEEYWFNTVQLPSDEKLA